jgi:1-acyl-sn-glycerol-3-phosphate acyltransferase
MMESQHITSLKLKFNHQLYNYWKNLGNRFLKIAHIECHGLEKINENEPAMLTPNHLNWKDIFLTAAMMRRPVRFAATAKLFDRTACYHLLDQYFQKYNKYPGLQNIIVQLNSFLAKFISERMKDLGAIPAKLDLYGNSLFEILLNTATENKVVCIFPEGGLGLPGKLRRFKLGAAKILYDYYLKNNISIPAYPVGITGTHKIIHPGMKVGFYVGSPLFIEEFIQSSEKQTLSIFIKQLQQAVDSLIESQ